MPTTSVSFRPPQLQYRYFECQGPRDVYSASWIKRKITTVKNDPQKRVRPAPPLWKSATSLPLQSTEVACWGYYYQGRTLYTSSLCNGKTFKVYRDVWNGNNGSGVRQIGRPSTNWSLGMRLRIKDASVNLGTALVEYRETANMFNKFARGVSSAWNDYRKIRKLRFKKVTPCTAAAAELIASYGIMPLAGDLFNSVQALNDRIVEPVYWRFVVNDRNTVRFNKNGYVGKWEVSERAVCYVQFVPDGPSAFTLGNPLELGWEAVPFSFVVDWAIPIGDYLSALDALKDVKAIKGTLTMKSWYDHVRSTPPPNGQWIVRPSLSYFEHRRDLITSIPLPRAPTWNPSASWRRIANGIALLTALNKRCQS